MQKVWGIILMIGMAVVGFGAIIGALNANAKVRKNAGKEFTNAILKGDFRGKRIFLNYPPAKKLWDANYQNNLKNAEQNPFQILNL